ncbi:MAG: crossover junction endodeoxyribonuclease RuvC [Anaerolineales bacterium]|nr:crossover junction endodeoxyribonuclease RuvC [Anaerolineales bacterium]MCZ2288642.1 crossover junction endodeoxyribonuclease RuvC [Anaerolineales bacterium]
MTLSLGIDPGLATTGYGLVRLEPDGRLDAVSFGVILTPKTDSVPARLESLYRGLRSLLKKHKPDTAAVEKLFFQRNVSTAIAVGQARGVALLALQQAGLEVFEYTPNEVKQAVAGYGSADKRQVQEMTRVLLQLNEIPKPDDAADALAIAITHLNTRRYEG